ncbi:hypothetical protein HELRODRAFT_176854 [Helobdella robusta]|uniref:Protein quiver n=1 Tax=Helobdella robusta TaxID=6412 RepID=T1FAZ2_HELRO|nr:hypothetical protein HELRODRAFT_176854 [Helobdella robusta]ESN98394.1 hypothetical protein HELRODRAFT_176854 [Helobdella robusta]
MASATLKFFIVCLPIFLLAKVEADVECYQCGGRDECALGLEKIKKCRGVSCYSEAEKHDQNVIYTRGCRSEPREERCTKIQYFELYFCDCRGDLCNRLSYSELEKQFGSAVEEPMR